MKNNHKRYKMLGVSLVAVSALLINGNNVVADETTDMPYIEKNSIKDDSSNQTVTIDTLDTSLAKENIITDKAVDEEVIQEMEEVSQNSEKVTTEKKTENYTKLPPAYKNIENTSATLLSVNDPSKVTHLQHLANKGLGNVIAVIDSGFDIEHSAFKLDKDIDKNKLYYSEATFRKLKQDKEIDYGQWINDKIIFVYDYINDTNIVGRTALEMTEDESILINHGTHVTGIVSANSQTTAENNLLVTGIAPNAQLMLMRVSTAIGDSKKTKDSSEVYAKAIKDAVSLGAKTITMSFGKTADSWIGLSPKVMEAIQLAKENGVALIAGVGNDGAFGMDYSNPLASNPDFGMISSPAISEDILTVTNYDSEKSISQMVTVEKAGQKQEFPIILSKSFDANQVYGFAFVDVPDDKQEFDNLAGKIALVQRPNSIRLDDLKPILEKLEGANASGVIIVNNQEYQSNILIPYTKIPVGFMGKIDGENLLKDTSATLSFNHIFKLVTNNGGLRMVPQSSWGLNAEGHIKPDIAAPGFEILSTLSDNSFGNLSGSSMSTPHVAGIVSLLQSHFANKYAHLNLSPAELTVLIKNVLMSSATALYSPEDKAYYSPRQQGAGAVNAEKAANANYYLTGEDGHAKINLKNVDDKFTFTVRIHNLDGKNHNLYYQTNLLTDQVINGKFALKPRSLYNSEWKAVTLVGDYTDLEITIDSSQFSQELTNQMKNGYFLDGFVRFSNNQNSKEEIMSIPFLGFKGDFANLPALEKSIYESIQSGSFYHKANNPENKFQLNYTDYLDEYNLSEYQTIKNKESKNNYTALLTEATPWFLSQDFKNGVELSSFAQEINKYIVLGTFAKQNDDKDESYNLVFDKNEKPYLVISPNGDQNRDKIIPQATFLRNVKDVKAIVLDAKGKVVWEQVAGTHYRKNYSLSKKETEGKYRIEQLVWEGKDNQNETVEDGLYTYRLLYTPVADDALEQHMDFSVIVSNKLPELPSFGNYNVDSGQLILEYKPSVDSLPIYRSFVAFAYEEGIGEAIEATDTDTRVSDEDELIFKISKYFYADENGMVIIPKEIPSEDGSGMITVDVNKLIVVVEDIAGNFNSIKLSELLKHNPSDSNAKRIDQSPKQELKPSEQDNQLSPTYKEDKKQSISSKPIFSNVLDYRTRETSASKYKRDRVLPQTADSKGSVQMTLGALFIAMGQWMGLKKKKKPRLKRVNLKCQ
ncbi:S8 family serine peptidase [Streptococcus phocae]|uniref:S8 family serine peptidase n=1 Tax=Streptococcus phocae TaxID=119224 RepID=UPI000A69E674|nr:S8 family serine peptidase [Streptococcus phocae]